MTSPSSPVASEAPLREKFEAAGQGQVFRFWDELGPDGRDRLAADARSVDLELVARLTAQPDEGTSAREDLEPPGAELVRIQDADEYRRMRNAAHDRGVSELASGHVAVVIAAGGQGTRLGGTAPKGLWPVGPRSGKPLFQWHFEKILFWARQVGRPIPIALLVSDATAQSTEEFLRWHQWFGVDPTWVRLARQRSLPATDASGKILLAAKDRIALAPNGHGGTFQALAQAKLLDLWADHGVRTIAYAQVDNPLLRTLDPVFLGFHARRESQFSSKSVVKRHPKEKVGVFARVGGRAAIVEYSELSAEQAHAVASDGTLLFGQGSIAAHCIDLAFARRMAEAGLPYHRARKKVPHVATDGPDAGRAIEPKTENGVKYETFLFDALPLAERTLVVEALREDEFSPIKNAAGDDSPDTARRDLIEMFRRWYRRAGQPVPEGSLEVNPLEAPDEHAFRRKLGLPWR